MANKALNAKTKILDAANSIFLQFGFHGTTLQQIATEADVNKAAIHYYFHSKEMLYFKVVEKVLDLIQGEKIQLITDKEHFRKIGWFLFTELYNNKELFERKVNELYQDDWENEIVKINRWLEFLRCESSMLTDRPDSWIHFSVNFRKSLLV